VTVTNTNNSVNGNTTATATSNAAAITVNSLTNAAAPNINTHPASGSVTTGTSRSVSVTASSPDGGTLSYQWYHHTAASNSGGTVIDGATSSSYNVPTGTAGTSYYYAEVTNTNTTVNGNTTAMTASNAAAITVNPIVNAATPNITAHPASGSVTTGTAGNVSVTASAPDGGMISYQWYSNTSANNSGGSIINGATNQSYNVPTGAAGTFHYYVEVTNTNSGVNGSTTAMAASNAATITINSLVNAAAPTITAQPSNASVTVNVAHSISVTANAADGGTMSYQWYRHTAASNSGGTAIGGATAASYSVPTGTAGTFHYYVEVTNTNNSVNGNRTAMTVSSAATIMVNSIVNAATPIISTHPANGSVTVNTAHSVSVSAVAPDGGTLGYQWYSNTSASNSGGAIINGATGQSYSVPTSTAGTVHYYVIVTNTNSSVNGNRTAVVTSNAVTITVTESVSLSDSTFRDDRDGRVYRKVTIGNQTWMAENLNFSGHSRGVSSCYNNADSNCVKYGRLYDWTAAMNGASSTTVNPSNVQGVCPAGWHLPSRAEWNDLVLAVGGSMVAGSKLKSEPPGWNGTDDHGFSALPGGFRSGSSFINVGTYGFWWSATEDSASGAWGRYMYSGDSGVNEFSSVKTFGYSVRCAKDNAAQ